MKHSFAAGLAAALAAVIAWGTQLPVAKDAFAVIDPFHITAIRYVVASLVLAPFLVMREGRGALRTRGLGWHVGAIGVLGMSASPMLVFYGISLSSAEHGAVIVALQPSLMALTLWLVYRQRPPGFTLACMAAAFVGVVLVITRGHLSGLESPREILGSVLVLAGGLCWVLYTLGTQRLAGWSTWRVTVLTMMPGAIATILFTGLLTLRDVLSTPTWHDLARVGWQLAFLTFVGVLFGMLAWNFGNRRIGPQNSTLLINLMPVVTFVFRAVQGHSFQPVEIAGATIVVVALVANNAYQRVRRPRMP
jgi:drug/metabolite transporter (DMT)-like permease